MLKLVARGARTKTAKVWRAPYVKDPPVLWARRRSEDLFAEARRAPALAALLGLRSEDLFVEGPPGALERAGRPSPTLADLVQICC